MNERLFSNQKISSPLTQWSFYYRQMHTTTATATTYPTLKRIYTLGVVVVGQLRRGVKHAWEWTTEVEYKARAQTERDRLNLSKSTRGSFDLDPTMPSTRRSKRMRSTKCTDPIRYGSFMFISFFLFFAANSILYRTDLSWRSSVRNKNPRTASGCGYGSVRWQ